MELFYGSLNNWLLKSVMEFSALRVSKYWFCLNLLGFCFCHGQEQSRHMIVSLPALLTSIKSNSSFVGNKLLRVTLPFLPACPAPPLELHHSYLQSSLVKDKKSETSPLSYTLTYAYVMLNAISPLQVLFLSVKQSDELPKRFSWGICDAVSYVMRKDFVSRSHIPMPFIFYRPA